MNNQVLYIDRFIKEAVSQEPAFLELAESTGLLELEGGGFLQLEESGDGTLFREVNYLDLDDRTRVATTYKGLDVSNLSSRTVSRTNEFSLPDTQRNRRLLGYSNDSKSNSDVPYSINHFSYEHEGITIIRGNGFINFERGRFEIVIYEETKTFFDAIEGLNLADIDTTLINPAGGSGTSFAQWLVLMENIRNNDSDDGIVAPVIDYGRFLDDPPDFISTAQITEYYLPCVYYSWVITKIFEQAGYEVENIEVLTSDRFKKLLIPWASDSFGHSDDFMERFYVALRREEEENFVTLGTGEEIIVPLELVYQGRSELYDGVGITIPALNTQLVFTYQCEIFFDIVVSGTGTFRIQLIGSGLGTNYTDTAMNQRVVFPQSADSGITLENVFDTETNIFIEVRRSAGTGTATFTIKRASLILVGKGDINQVQRFSVAGILPQITQKEMLKDFFFRFGLIPQESSNKIKLITIESIINDKHKAKDWTEKRVKSDNTISNLSSYAQENTIRYENSDGVGDWVGEGIIRTQDKKAIPKENMLTFQFQNSSDTVKGEIVMAHIPVYDADSDDFKNFSQGPGNRLLYIRDKNTLEPNVAFLNSQSSYQVAHFEDPNEDITCKFQENLDLYYPTFINSLQQEKRIKRIYYLDTIDFHNFVFVEDEIFLIFDDGEYFLVEEIRNYLPGQPVEVSLFKVT